MMFHLEPIATAPVLELTPQDVATIIDELRAYHAIYSPLFQRREQREWSEHYLHGLLLNIPRKSIEPMVLSLKGADHNAVRAMQQFLGEGTWDDAAILTRHWQEVDADLGDDDGVLILDGSDFPKQGQESVGVKRQYCGELGKTANCQAGVFVAYASQQGYALLDRRLYLPEEWLTDEAFAARRKACGVPETTTFSTKPLLGWSMIEAIQQAGTLRYRWVTCDEGFGRDTTLLDKIDSLGLWYFAEVPHDTYVWQTRPATAVPEWSGHGRKPTRPQLLDPTLRLATVVEIAGQLPSSGWERRAIKEGSQGRLVAEFAFVRVIAVRSGLPGPEVTLVLRRSLTDGELIVLVSFSSSSTSWALKLAV
jgi:SRSO17 transposase